MSSACCIRLKQALSRRLLARLLSTLICSSAIVIHPVSQFGGPSAFLALSIKELGFSVQNNVAQQVEATVLNIFGAFFAIGIACLAHSLASLTKDGTQTSRAIPACILVSFAFIAGWVKSRLPRLSASMRVACFISIWMLTDNTPRQRIPIVAQNFTWITLIAASSSLLPSLLFLRQRHPQYVAEVADALSVYHQCLAGNMDRWTGSPSEDIQPLQKQLLKQSIALAATYRQHAFEIRVGYIAIKQLKPLMSTIEFLRRELAWGMPPTRSLWLLSSSVPGGLRSFRGPSLELASTILVAISVMQRIITIVFENFTRSDLGVEKETVRQVRRRLHESLNLSQARLETTYDYLEHREGGSDGISQQDLDACLIMISLLRMVKHIQQGLDVIGALIASHERAHLQLMLPVPTSAWLGVSTDTIASEYRDDVATTADDLVPFDTLSEHETAQGINETHSSSASSRYVLRQSSPALVVLRVLHIIDLWNAPRLLRARLFVFSAVRSIKNSHHLQHGLKNAFGVAILSFLAFLPEDSHGRRWFTLARGQWMVISYIWVLETNTGATYRVGYLRLTGTLLGVIYSYVAWLICRANPYGLVAAAVLIDLPASFCVMYTKFPSLAVVGVVTLPPILFAEYFQTTLTVSRLAVLRGLMISAGIVAAVAVNNLLFPRHCRVLFLNNASRAINYLGKLYLSISRDLMMHRQRSRNKRHDLKLELSIQDVLHGMSILLVTMNDELSLVPKPMRKYQQVISVLQRFLDLMTGLREIRETIPRKDTVLPLVQERREFMSCICLSLFASEHVFRSRNPLPQFLPSSILSLHKLGKCMKDRVLQSCRVRNSETYRLPAVYTLAEMDLLRDIVVCLEELLELCRDLFGVSEWCNLPTDLAEVA